MRQNWFRATGPRRCLGVVLAFGLAVTGVGCHQNYYYYGDACAPGTAIPSTVRTTGPVCDVPTQEVEGGTRQANGSSRSTVVSGAKSNTSSRVVVSEPREPAKDAWRRSDPDSGLAASTSVEGAINESTVR